MSRRILTPSSNPRRHKKKDDDYISLTQEEFIDRVVWGEESPNRIVSPERNNQLVNTIPKEEVTNISWKNYLKRKQIETNTNDFDDEFNIDDFLTSNSSGTNLSPNSSLVYEEKSQILLNYSPNKRKSLDVEIDSPNSFVSPKELKIVDHDRETNLNVQSNLFSAKKNEEIIETKNLINNNDDDDDFNISNIADYSVNNQSSNDFIMKSEFTINEYVHNINHSNERNMYIITNNSDNNSNSSSNSNNNNSNNNNNNDIIDKFCENSNNIKNQFNDQVQNHNISVTDPSFSNNLCDEIEFSEEDFAKIDAEIELFTQKQNSNIDLNQNTNDDDNNNNNNNNKQSIQNIQNNNNSSSNLESEITDEDMALLFDEIDKTDQLLSSQKNYENSINYIQISNNNDGFSSSYSAVKMSNFFSEPVQLKTIEPIPASSELYIQRLSFDSKSKTISTILSSIFLRLMINRIEFDGNKKKILYTTQEKDNLDDIETNDLEIIVELCDSWYNSSVNIGEIVHVINVSENILVPFNHIEKLNNGVSIPFNDKNSIFSSSILPIRIVLNDSIGLLISLPNYLLSPSKINETYSCNRRGILKDRYNSYSGGKSSSSNSAAILGNVRHYFVECYTEYILNALANSNIKVPSSENELIKLINKSQIDIIIKQSISLYIVELYSININDDEIKKDLLGLIPSITQWIYIMITKGVGTCSLNYSPTNSINIMYNNDQFIPLDNDSKFVKVVNVEEMITSQILGIKGQVDMIAGGKIFKPNEGDLVNLGNSIDLIIPIEFKTGKWRSSVAISHRAQVILYIFLMILKDRSLLNYDNNLNQINNVSPSYYKPSVYGLLLYLGENDLKIDFIRPQWFEIRSLIIARNNLARGINDSIQNNGNSIPIHFSKHYQMNQSKENNSSYKLTLSQYDYIKEDTIIKQTTFLPPILHNSNECTYCYSASECVLNQVAENYVFSEYVHDPALNYSEITGNLLEIQNYVLKDIKNHHLKFFYFWNHLIDLEYLEYYKQSSKKDLSSTDFYSETISGLIYSSSSPLTIKNKKNLEIKFIIPNSYESSIDLISNLILYDVNDRVSISVDRNINFLDHYNLQTKEGLPIHLSSLLKKSTKNFLSSSNLCSGFITSINSNSIAVCVTSGSKVIASVLETILSSKYSDSSKKSNEWTFSLRKEENNVSNQVMRSNLLDLFVEPFSVKSYLQAKNPVKFSKLVEESYNDPSIQRLLNYNANRQRIRELIVDLIPPSFSHECQVQLGNIDSYILLCCPPNFDSKLYKKCIEVLKIYEKYEQKNFNERQPRPNNFENMSANLLYKPYKKLPISLSNKNEIVIDNNIYIVYPGCNPLNIIEDFCKCNDNQKEAILKILTTKDYSLLWGLPGTGKTSTISLLIRILIARGETVLLTAFTHNAVDNLFEKLIEKGLTNHHMLRVTSSTSNPIISTLQSSSSDEYNSKNTSMNSISSICQNYCLDTTQYLTINDLKHKLNTIRLYACPVLTASRSLLINNLPNMLDWCIVDEAGQLTLLNTIGVILKTKKFVLIGDDYQLPPLVLSHEGKSLGSDLSLFKKLMDVYGSIAMVPLRKQYRMNYLIMKLINNLIYNNQMIGGSENVLNAKLYLQYFPKLLPSNSTSTLPSSLTQNIHLSQTPRSDWLFHAINPENSVVFLNIDQLPYDTSLNYLNIINNLSLKKNYSYNFLNNFQYRSTESLVESLIIKLLLYSFEKCGFSSLNDLAVLSPFRNQIKLADRIVNITSNQINNNLKFKSNHINLSYDNNSTGQNYLSEKLFSTKLTRLFEISTIDKYQGKDRDVIILSLVKRLPESLFKTLQGKNELDEKEKAQIDESIGMLLKDWRRINVALTRSKLKLIIIGSSELMKYDELLNKVILECKKNTNGYLDLPPNALNSYL